MNQKEIVECLNEKYKGRFVFEVTDSEDDIVGFADDGTFKNIIAVIEPTEQEMKNLIKHIEKWG